MARTASGHAPAASAHAKANGGAKGVRQRRVYDPPASDDGLRVLVDRLWPRGVSRGKSHVDLWVRDLAPSDELRRWFAHRPDRFEEFRRRYLAELEDHDEELDALARGSRRGTVSLLFGARDRQHNNAAVVAEAVRDRSESVR